MNHLIVDGMLSGSGIRDKINGGYLVPSDLGLSAHLCSCISAWLNEYEEAHYLQFEDRITVERLDAKGLRIARNVQTELPNSCVHYFSHADMKYVELQ